nr:histone-lysine N-methyltransferase SETD1A-like [Ipomoea batatas]
MIKLMKSPLSWVKRTASYSHGVLDPINAEMEEVKANSAYEDQTSEQPRFWKTMLVWKVWDSKRQSQSFDDPSSLQNQKFLFPLASFQPPSHHHQLRQPPTTTPPEKNQSHEEESKVVGHCQCCLAGGSFVASLPLLSPLHSLLRSELPETNREPPDTNAYYEHGLARRPYTRMSGSDSQNISGRDYDDGDEAGNESFTLSSGGSIFNQIDEVEHVSADTDGNEGPLRTPTSTEDASTSGRGKSLRVVVSALFPHLSPRTGREGSSSTPNPGRLSALPSSGGVSSSAPNPTEADSASDEPVPLRKKMIFLNREVVQQQECLLTRAEIDEIHALLRSKTPEDYKKANLEPPVYGRGEKYEPKPITSTSVPASSSQDMVLNKGFTTPSAPRPPRAKVALGAKKAAPKPSTDSPVVDLSAPVPADTPSGSVVAPDLHVTQGQSHRGKEKRQEPEVEEVLTLKRTKRSTSSRSSELHEGLRERDTLATALVDRIRDKVPGIETIMEWSCERLGEQIAEDILLLTHTMTDLFYRARVLENIREKEVGPMQKQVTSAEVKIKELEKALAVAESRAEKAEKDFSVAEGRAEKAEKVEQEAMDKMKDASSLARFICTKEAIAKEFLTAFVNTEVGYKLVWVYGQWAFTLGCRAMQEQRSSARVVPSIFNFGFINPFCRRIVYLQFDTLLPSASRAIRSANHNNRAPCSRDGHLAPIGLKGHKVGKPKAIGHLTPEMGTLLPSASRAIRSANQNNRAPSSRDGHLTPIGLKAIRSANQNNRAPYFRDRHLAPIGLKSHKFG